MGGKGHPNLNLDERLAIEKMLKEGARPGTIATTIGRTHSCIKQEIRKMGGRLSYDGRKSQWRADEINRAKIRSITKGLTDEEAKKITHLFGLGESMNGMSVETGISHHRISAFLKANGMIPKKMGHSGFRARIENLEQQCEILFDLIKDKK